jgi:hypothetical protein
MASHFIPNHLALARRSKPEVERFEEKPTTIPDKLCLLWTSSRDNI